MLTTPTTMLWVTWVSSYAGKAQVYYIFVLFKYLFRNNLNSVHLKRMRGELHAVQPVIEHSKIYDIDSARFRWIQIALIHKGKKLLIKDLKIISQVHITGINWSKWNLQCIQKLKQCCAHLTLFDIHSKIYEAFYHC